MVMLEVVAGFEVTVSVLMLLPEVGPCNTLDGSMVITANQTYY